MNYRRLNKILFDCHQATFLSVKREETGLTLAEWVNLHYHLLHCKLCRQFAVQSRGINRALEKFRKAIEKDPPFILSEEAKSSILEKIRRLEK
jgi:hypothetical protein